jgi:hypothetical protein
MSAEDPRVANARRALDEVETQGLDRATVWSQHAILEVSLRMLLTYVDGESFDAWSARISADAREHPGKAVPQ